MDYVLGLILAALSGAGIVSVGDPLLYTVPKAFFGLA